VVEFIMMATRFQYCKRPINYMKNHISCHRWCFEIKFNRSENFIYTKLRGSIKTLRHISFADLYLKFTKAILLFENSPIRVGVITFSSHISLPKMDVRIEIFVLKYQGWFRLSKFLWSQHRYLIYLDSASNCSAIQKLKPWLQTQDIPMKWEDSYVFCFLNRELKH
jgi:hypothetical protein